MAFIVLHPEHALKWKGRYAEFEKELKDHAKSRLPGFARPEWVEIVRVLPVSFNGLVLVSVAILNDCPENIDWKDPEDGVAQGGCKIVDFVLCTSHGKRATDSVIPITLFTSSKSKKYSFIAKPAMALKRHQGKLEIKDSEIINGQHN